MSFIHLHVHSTYSSLDGAQTPIAIANRAKELGCPAIALTDHGNMHGIIPFYQACKKVGIKPILGQEFYFAPRERTFKEGIEGIPPAYHLTILAMNEAGLKNLFKMSSIAYLEGFYYKPRIDWEILKEYSDNIIVLSGCLKGTIQWYIAEHLRTKEEKFLRQAYTEAETFKDILGDRFYLEIQRITPVQDLVIPIQEQIANHFNIQCVTTCDAHYPRAEDVEFHQQLICLATGTTILDQDRTFFAEGHSLHIHSRQEMEDKFPDRLEWLNNSLVIANRCSEISFPEKASPLFPIYSNSHENDIKLFEGECWQGLKERGLDTKQEYIKQLEYEIKSIKDMGFPSYFLVVADYVRWAKQIGIHCGAGRGSAAGSLVSYCLSITEVDPLKHGLFFERFINLGRKGLPDVDSDFEPRARELIVQHLQEKYGADKVAHIATFGEFKPRGSIRDFARVQGEPYEVGDEASKLVPPDVRGKTPSWDECLRVSPELMGERFSKITSMARKSEGLVRQPGIHAGGIVIGPIPLDQVCPLMLGREGEIVTQWDMDIVEKIGLIKMDVLGLTACTTIRMCLDIIKQTRNQRIDIYNIPQNDTKTFEMISSGDTDGLFQLDAGGGIRELTLRIQPRSIDDLAIISALFRPGPLDSGMTEAYTLRRIGKQPVEYIIPQLEPILKDTYGCLVYQESVMKIAVELAGYTLSEADDIRKAVGKKKADLMAQQEQKIVQGMKSRGIREKDAREIWNAIKTNAEYSFNKAHSVAYAYTTYQMAWLKANYPVEFYCALLTQHMDEQEKIVEYMQRARERGIKVLPPDINESNNDFTVANQVIRFGLAAIKDVGGKACEKILKERANGNFSDIYNLLERAQSANINKRTLEALAKSGALDSLKVPRAGILDITIKYSEYKDELKSYYKKMETFNKRIAAYQQRLEEIKQAKEKGEKAKPSLKYPTEPQKPIVPEVQMGQELSFAERLGLERETMGLFISGHPLEEYRLGRETTHIQAIKEDSFHNEEVDLLGIIISLKVITTKTSGRKMAFVTLEDMTGTIETVIFPDTFQKEAENLIEGKVIGLSAKVDAKVEGNTKLIAQRIYQPIYLKKKEKTIQYNGLLINSTSTDMLETVSQVLKDKANEVELKTVDVQVNGTTFRLANPRKIGQNTLNKLLSLPNQEIKGIVVR